MPSRAELNEREELAALPDATNARRPPRWTWIAICSALYTLALGRTINGASLATDEAFSAFIACHRSIQSLWSTLWGGDSSDLQAWMHYLYLHLWVRLFGSTEIAMRSANYPFILLFAVVLVWISGRAFDSRWLWVLPASLPFLWIFASEIRAYFALVAFGMLFFSGLLAYQSKPSQGERRVLPWIVLASLLAGATFHMLMQLAVLPALIFLGVNQYGHGGEFRLRDWRWPVLAFSLPFGALGCYLWWTFGRGTAYDYARPTLNSFGSIVLQFFGLSGYRSEKPNPPGWTPAFLLFAAGLGLLMIGLLALAWTGFRSRRRVQFSALSAALAVSLLQAGVLSFAIHEQFELRHLAALTPLILLLVMAGAADFAAEPRTSVAPVAFVCLLVCWLVSDYRLVTLPEYEVEDYRSTVAQAIERQQQDGGDLLWLADPIAPAYYTLAMQGKKPCFPLATSCEEGFQKVDWHDHVPAAYGWKWTPEQVQAWLAEHRKSGTPTIVVQTIWHPIYEQSAWWPVLQAQPAAIRARTHGFVIYELR